MGELIAYYPTIFHRFAGKGSLLLAATVSMAPPQFRNGAHQDCAQRLVRWFAGMEGAHGLRGLGGKIDVRAKGCERYSDKDPGAD